MFLDKRGELQGKLIQTEIAIAGQEARGEWPKPVPPKRVEHRTENSRSIEDAVDQLTKYDPSRALLHAIWFHCEGYDADLHEDQLHATIYGTQCLYSRERRKPITCYYFRNSSFYRHASNLDAVIVSKRAEIPIHMALNNYSPRFHAIQQSKLAQAFGPAAIYPQQYEKDQDIMVCDHEYDRRSETQTLDYLRAKYGLAHLETITGRKIYEAVGRVSRNVGRKHGTEQAEQGAD